jgi:hypothetical protein
MEEFSLTTVAGDGKFLLFVAFEIIQNSVRLCITTGENYKMYIEKKKKGMHSSDVKVTADSET